RLVVAPRQHVSVQRVEAGVADAAGEPAAVDAGVGVEHLLRRRVPIDVLRRLAPEAFRVALPAGVDLMVAARAGVHGLPRFLVLATKCGTAENLKQGWRFGRLSALIRRKSSCHSGARPKA